MSRLPADAPHGFGGAEIDRKHPLSFRLDGRVIHGFAGDTVLSAVLAAGIDAVGLRHGVLIGLDERCAPPVALVSTARDPAAALPMDRTPAVSGLDLVTLSPHRWLPGPRRSLNCRIDDRAPLQPPWERLSPEATLDADLLVVGGGVAGMNAALAAANEGARVILIERRPMLGGDARFFGAMGEEEAPEPAIARLTNALGSAGVTILRRTEAFVLAGTSLTAHQVELREGALSSRVITLTAPRIVLATGAPERLPLFPGNRGPGITGSVAAFHRAERHGVWVGHRTLVSTPHSPAYRLALLAKDAGVAVQRVADTRINPQSRFVDFAKASGITLSSGMIVREALPAARDPAALSVSLALAIADVSPETNSITTDRLIAAGGWQPELSLWLMAGGKSAWNAAAGWLEASGTLAHVALAGAAAGYRGSGACQQSGKAAVAQLYGRRELPVVDPQLDAIYETPDMVTQMAPGRLVENAPTFLDGGLSFILRPGTSPEAPAEVLAPGRSLDIGDVAAAVQLGAVPQAEAGSFAEQRCLGAGDIIDTGWKVPSASTRSYPMPAFLFGRFGAHTAMIIVVVEDGRSFEPGCLIFADSSSSDPHLAIGVIVGPAPEGQSGGLALTGKLPETVGVRYFVRDSSGAVPVRLMERQKPPGA